MLRGELSPGELFIGIGSPAESLAMARDYWSGDELNREAIELARLAKRDGPLVGVLSNAYGDLSAHFQSWGIADLFDDIVVSALVGIIKPEPAIYRLACLRLQVQLCEVVLLDDNSENVQSAIGVGLHALQYSGEETLITAAEALGLPWRPCSVFPGV